MNPSVRAHAALQVLTRVVGSHPWIVAGALCQVAGDHHVLLWSRTAPAVPRSVTAAFVLAALILLAAAGPVYGWRFALGQTLFLVTSLSWAIDLAQRGKLVEASITSEIVLEIGAVVVAFAAGERPATRTLIAAAGMLVCGAWSRWGWPR